MISATVDGTLGRDAELRETSHGTVLKFGIASEEKVRGEKVTTWVNVSLWGKRGQALERFMKKGARVVVCGVLRPREGDTKTFYDLDDVSGVSITRYPDDGDSLPPRDPHRQAQPRSGGAPTFGPDDDDIPF